jgi:ketosteroid isomerase-like protein
LQSAFPAESASPYPGPHGNQISEECAENQVLILARTLRAFIESANHATEQLVARGDAAAITKLYARDAQVISPRKPMAIGRNEVEGLYQATFNLGFDSLDVEILEISRVGPMVYEIGKFHYEHTSGVVPIHGKYMCIWKWDEGTWLIHREISNL